MQRLDVIKIVHLPFKSMIRHVIRAIQVLVVVLREHMKKQVGHFIRHVVGDWIVGNVHIYAEDHYTNVDHQIFILLVVIVVEKRGGAQIWDHHQNMDIIQIIMNGLQEQPQTVQL